MLRYKFEAEAVSIFPTFIKKKNAGMEGTKICNFIKIIQTLKFKFRFLKHNVMI